MKSKISSPDIETHPWPPFIPENAKILIMGTFPPGPHRWSMDFYYPNRTNDFWPMMGLVFCNDRYALMADDHKTFCLPAIKSLLTTRGIALNDTGHRIRRLKGNASDKFLEIIEPVNLDSLLAQMPECRAIATTGQKAAEVIASITHTAVPSTGSFVTGPSGINIWRMPSTSRAYPLSLDKKADFYRHMFISENI